MYFDSSEWYDVASQPILLHRTAGCGNVGLWKLWLLSSVSVTPGWWMCWFINMSVSVCLGWWSGPTVLSHNPKGATETLPGCRRLRKQTVLPRIHLQLQGTDTRFYTTLCLTNNNKPDGTSERKNTNKWVQNINYSNASIKARGYLIWRLLRMILITLIKPVTSSQPNCTPVGDLRATCWTAFSITTI